MSPHDAEGEEQGMAQHQAAQEDVLILRDRQNRCYKIPIEALAEFEMNDQDTAKAVEALGEGDTQGFGLWSDLVTYKSGGHTDKLEALAYKMIWS